MGQFWMEITALSGSDFDGIQQSTPQRILKKGVEMLEKHKKKSAMLPEAA